jgi:glycosyltransferase involved in cell wall biosynthesis
MRIAHIIDSLDPSQGGPPVSTVSLAAAQATLGHDVTVVSNEFSDSSLHLNRLLGEIPNSDRVTIQFVSQKNYLDKLFGVSAKRFFATNMHRWDLLHLHGLWRPILWAAAKGAIEQNTKWGLAPKGMLHPWALQQKRWKKRLALELGWRRVIRHAAFLHLLNIEEKIYVERLMLDCPIEVIPNGFFSEKMDCSTNGLISSVEMVKWMDRPYILFLGRLHDVKGLNYLADAFAIVAQHNSEINLVVAGPDAGMLQQFKTHVCRLGISRQVHVVGMLFGVNKYAAIRNAVCLCQPSRQEGFSMTIIEALASGVPVVISKNCHFPEVGELGAGCVVELNAMSIANALLHIVNNDEWRKVAGQKARDLALAKYTWPKIAERSIHVYERVTI